MAYAEYQSLLAWYNAKKIGLAENQAVLSAVLQTQQAYQPKTHAEKIQLLHKLIKNTPYAHENYTDFSNRLIGLFEQGFEPIVDDFLHACVALHIDPVCPAKELAVQAEKDMKP